MKNQPCPTGQKTKQKIYILNDSLRNQFNFQIYESQVFSGGWGGIVIPTRFSRGSLSLRCASFRTPATFVAVPNSLTQFQHK